MWGRYLPHIPRPPPKPNLGRPVWGPYMPSDHLGLEGKRLQLQPRSPLGGRSCLGEPPSKTKLENWRGLHRLTLHQRAGVDTGTLTLRCVTTWPGVWTPLDSPPHCTVPYQGFLIRRPNKRNKRLLFNIVDWLIASTSGKKHIGYW